MKRKLKHLFIPHTETHQKAHLLSWHFLVIYILLFILLQAGFNLLEVYKPGILGVNASITSKEIIERVNQERREKGLGPLKEDQNLAQAASAKATNMFEENYWAHFAPSGKDPWGFIASSGYKFSYAGENLARNFSNSPDVVDAWMNSPSHRDNILNSKYEDIGIAVVEGVLQGQKTTLIVQMFGKTYQPLASLPEVNLGGEKIVLEEDRSLAERPVFVASSNVENLKIYPEAKLNPYSITKSVALGFFFLITLLITIDFIVLKRRGVYRFSSHHLAHLSFLGLNSVSIFISRAGEIL